jgi:hypothetical protein
MPHLFQLPPDADVVDERAAARFADTLKEALRDASVRFVFWQLLEETGVFRSVTSLGLDHVLWRAGRQDIGHELVRAIVDADDEAYHLMWREARQREHRVTRERQALHESRKRNGPKDDTL